MKFLIIAMVVALSVATTFAGTGPDVVFKQKRQALIDRVSPGDPTFAVLGQAMISEDTYSADYWRWKIDQYLYGQYPEFQPIYDAFAAGKPFREIYDLPEDLFGAPPPKTESYPRLPDGYFSANLPGNVHTGSTLAVGDRVYVAYQGKLTDPYIASFDTKTGEWEGPFQAGRSTLSKNGRRVDSHGRPALFQDALGHFHLIFGGHGGEREDGLNPLSIDTPHAGGRLTHIMSERPHDISRFRVVDDISPFASYTQVQRMADGDVYMFTRAGTHKSPWIYYKMAHGSQRFGEAQLITWPVPQRDSPMNVDTFYIATKRISAAEIAITYLWHPCNFREIHNRTHYDRINTYYVTLDTRTDAFYNARGEALVMPLDKASSDRFTLAHNSAVRNEYCFSTRPMVRPDGKPAAAYEAWGADYREWRMAVFDEGRWESGLPMPAMFPESLVDGAGNPLKAVNDFAVIARRKGAISTAAVIYKDVGGEAVFGIARAESAANETDPVWRVEEEVVRVSKARIQMQTVGEESGSQAVILNIREGGSQRLYLWHDGAFRTRK